MGITVKVNGVDRTSLIEQNLRISDNLYSDTDECQFEYLKYGSRDWIPQGHQTVEVYDGETKIFGGRIIEIERELISSNVEKFSISCKDFVEDMDGYLATEDYQEKTVEFIIEDLVSKYLEGLGFTTNNVSCEVVINRILFDAKPISKCIDELAKYTNYQWYIDPDKDIHFFARGEEVAPFNLTDTSNNYLFQSLKLKEDYSQIINSILVEGGAMEGGEIVVNFRVTEEDVFEEKKEFSTREKFARLPKVYVNDVEMTVGVDGLDKEEDFDVLWSYQQQTIKFKDDNKPVAGDKITLEGIVEISVLFPASDVGSIATYGKKQVRIIDKTIKSLQDAIQRASAEIDAYKEKLNEGSFITYNAGLRSGQKINIKSEQRGIDQDFIIRSVSFTMKGYDSFEYEVDLITQRTMGLVDFLQKQVLDKDKEIEIPEGQQITKCAFKDEVMVLSEEIVKAKGDDEEEMTPEWVFGDYAPTGMWADDKKRVPTFDSGAKFKE